MTLLGRQNVTTGNIVTSFNSLPTPGIPGRRAALNNSLTEFIDDGSQWRPLVNGYLCSNVPDHSLFTKFNQGSSSISNQNGNIYVTDPTLTSSLNLRGMYRTATNSPIVISSSFITHAIMNSTDPGFNVSGVVMTNGSSFFALETVLGNSNGSYAQYFQWSQWSSVTSRTTTNSIPVPIHSVFFVQLHYDGSNFLCYYGFTPNDWIFYYSHPASFVPNSVGLCWMDLDKGGARHFLHYSESLT